MEDAAIIDLYWSRREEAIRETDAVYGRKLYILAKNIVLTHEDAQECVSDTYLKAWESIPPQRPRFFYAYLAKLCRNVALGKLDWKNAARRKAEVVALTQEMETCIPDRRPETSAEGREISDALNCFLGTLSRENRRIFLRRYWYMDTVADIALHCGISESKVKSSLHRTRGKLRTYLEGEGITL